MQRVGANVNSERDGVAGLTTAEVAGEVDQAVVEEGLASLATNRDRPYYDAAADANAATEYYSGVDATATGAELMGILQALVTRTHTQKPNYKPTVMVYPWVDLHPDRQLRSIYSGKTFDPADVIRDDARIEAERTLRLRDFVTREAAIGPDAFADELDELDAQMPYNCEHVVPQSYFTKREPMRGDLHHLFTCESRCNSFRSNTPYFDFGDDERAVMQDCGRSEPGEPGRFEPRAGKGAVARATMYFLLRYPGLVGDVARELHAERLPILLAWHESEPVEEWERHRNAAIFEIQGNRNPLIDNPQWASRIPFETAFGSPGG
jgi:endonuclease G, mitochondrial